MVFCSQTNPFLAVSTFILYDDGIMDESFRDNTDSLSFFEFNRYDADWSGSSKDMPTVGTKNVIDTDWHSGRAIMVY
jgi:hypothetical protein